ncbi:MAG TPA: molybdopterin-dependent oxidoreductase, partial [Candidatus Humimicrobiaceae bacterium]|nr:molybdopterin-dependent oxidoreductase [Candidatus Humimicrobiaceae bacterium]
MKKLKILWIPILITAALIVFLISGCGKEGGPEVVQPDEEVEATEFQGTKLTPIEDQLNNALAGTQILDRDTYTLTVDGLVNNPLTLTYDELMEYPQ